MATNKPSDTLLGLGVTIAIVFAILWLLPGWFKWLAIFAVIGFVYYAVKKK